MALRFISDPGHGWLEVSSHAMTEVGLSFGSFSRYSYWDGGVNCLYLEEDCDAGKFVAAFVKRHGREPVIKEVHCDRDCFVRRLPRLV